MSGNDTRHRGFGRALGRAARAIACVCVALGACNADPGYGGRSSDEWISQLSQRDVDGRVDAALALGKVLALQPNAPRVIRALVVALADTNDEVRVTAADGLRNAARGGERVQASLARNAVPGIVAILGDSQHVAVRRDAARILGTLGATAAAATVEPLSRALKDPAPDVRREAALALSGLGETARLAVPRLLEASLDPDVDMRGIVLRALAASAESTSVVGPALIRGLRDSSAMVRAAVATGLGQRSAPGIRALDGPAGSKVLPIRALRAATRDPVIEVRLAAVTALGLLGDSTGRPDIERALADPDSAVRREAAHALTALHRRGGRDPSLPEPSLFELCRSNPRWPGC